MDYSRDAFSGPFTVTAEQYRAAAVRLAELDRPGADMRARRTFRRRRTRAARLARTLAFYQELDPSIVRLAPCWGRLASEDQYRQAWEVFDIELGRLCE